MRYVNSIIRFNRRIRVMDSYPNFSLLKFHLTLYNPKDGTIFYAFEDYENYIEFRSGLYEILCKCGLIDERYVQDERTHVHDRLKNQRIYTNEYLREILPGIELRNDQIESVRRCMTSGFGNVQASTGSGKSVMISAIIKCLCNSFATINNPKIPKCLILVPTKFLMEEMKNTLERFGIKSQLYSDVRSNWNGIVVAHPKSINNDLDNGIVDLSDLDLLIGDEVHHVRSDTWKRLFDLAVNTEFIFGFSASLVSSSKLPIDSISKLSVDEVLMIESTGDVLINIEATYYTNNDILAQPLAVTITNTFDVYADPKNWHDLRKLQLESDNRSIKAVEISDYMNAIGLKTLILLSTRNHACNMLRMFYDCGLGNKTICSFGGKEFLMCDDCGEIIKVDKNSMDRFKSGELTIMLGTSHIYEGVDIPNLDCVIMLVVGKSVRRIIQGVGRSLRRTKNGKYAYIVDFTDSNSGVLKYHSRLRVGYYRDIIGVPESRLFENISVSQFKNLVDNIENNDYLPE